MPPSARRLVARALLLGLAPAPLLAQQGAQDGEAPKLAAASRAPARALRVDGRLDEPAWRTAPPVTDFVQKEPVEGAPPGDPTEVRFLYDDEALWVGARMTSSGGREAIQASLSRRDEVEQADYLRVCLDTWLDRRTAYCFGVAASGVRLDHYHPADSEGDREDEFDPVWEARVTVDDGGWTAEMWIPYSQLRFTAGEEQVWGLNVHRWVPARNEDDYWVTVPRTVQGWASRFGELRRIEGVEPPARLELLPYVAGGATLTGDRDRADPFDDGRNLAGRVGADLKMGIGTNLTLEATVNPDFGQIEADPAVVNLTAFESFFSERRPFFTEGGQLIAGGVNNYFYSRRVGAAPAGPADGDFVDYPASTTILGAAKLSGRTAAGTSLAVLAAVTGEEHARTFDAQEQVFDRVRVNPRTAFGAARVLRQFGQAGSTASLLVTGVHRDLDPGDPLAARLTRDAFSVSGESLLRLAGGRYEVFLNAGLSHVAGDALVITRLQRASQRYFQRPDAEHLEVDPLRTSLGGLKAQARIEKTGGRHWLWETFFDVESPEVEFNDLGRLTTGDGLQTRQSLTWRETEPGRLLRGYRVSASHASEWNFDLDRQYTRLSANGSVTWNNFWTTNASSTLSLRAQDQRLTRGGPSMGTPLGWSASLDLRSPGSAETRWDAGLDVGRDELGGWNARLDGGLSFRPSPQLQLSLGPGWERETNPRQFVNSRAGGPPETFGSRYIFAFTDRTTLSTQLRVNFTVRPDLNLDVYAEPFAASGRFYDLGELGRARGQDLRVYGSDGASSVERNAGGDMVVSDGAQAFVIQNPDFNVRSFRSTTVLRWEWRPGSTLYLVWQQDRSEDEELGTRVGPGDMLGSLGSGGDNFLAVKASLWIPR